MDEARSLAAAMLCLLLQLLLLMGGVSITLTPTSRRGTSEHAGPPLSHRRAKGRALDGGHLVPTSQRAVMSLLL